MHEQRIHRLLPDAALRQRMRPQHTRHILVDLAYANTDQPVKHKLHLDRQRHSIILRGVLSRMLTDMRYLSRVSLVLHRAAPQEKFLR